MPNSCSLTLVISLLDLVTLVLSIVGIFFFFLLGYRQSERKKGFKRYSNPDSQTIAR